MNAAELLAAQRIVPVVVIDDASHAVPLAETLLENGLHAIEVTLRTAATTVPGEGSGETPVTLTEIVAPAARGREDRVSTSRCEIGIAT